MSDALIASLQKQLDDRNAALATANAEAKDRRIKMKRLQAEHDALKAEHEKVVRARDDFEAAAKTAPEEWRTKHDALARTLATRDHRDAFTIVKEFQVKVKDEKGAETEKAYTLAEGVAMPDVWAKAGYTPEGETPDGAKVKEHYAAALKAAPYLFREKAETAHGAPGGATNPQRGQAVRPGPGAGRGDNNQPQQSALSQVQTGKPRIPGKL